MRLGGLGISLLGMGDAATSPAGLLALPDPLITEAYGKAAQQNVLAAVNESIFPGYFSVCADGHGFGYGNTYPSLDGHQMSDALLWLGQVDVVKSNWDYVKSFQRPDGCLPLAILPSKAGKDIGPAGYPGVVEANGGLYRHWVPGNPLAALASPTYIQNADVIFRRTLDQRWLSAQIASINLAADFLASLTTAGGAVKGGGYYVERPSRLDSDGVTQPHAIDAFRRVSAFHRLLGDAAAAARYERLAERVQANFVTRFWMKDHFAEYVNPEHGLIDRHGLSDSDWSALAFGALTPEQESVLWPRLRDEQRFYYGGMPSGIVTEPEKYEAWEFSYPDRNDLAAMGRVWYVESQARARMGDAAGLLDGIRRVAKAGRESGYFWRERYTAKGGHGAEKYCEYPANLIRIVQRFLLGVDLRLDGTIALSPTVTDEFRQRGFGQRLSWRGRTLDYRMVGGEVTGTYSGDAQDLAVQFKKSPRPPTPRVTVNAKTAAAARDGDLVWVNLPASAAGRPCRFEIRS